MKPRVYIDTSVIGGYYDDEFSTWSRILIDQIIKDEIIALISDHTVDEILDAPANVQSILEIILRSNSKELLSVNDEAIELANSYQQEGAISEKFFEDALHIAIATIHNAIICILPEQRFRRGAA